LYQLRVIAILSPQLVPDSCPYVGSKYGTDTELAGERYKEQLLENQAASKETENYSPIPFSLKAQTEK
jgi:hypothetical protein